MTGSNVQRALGWSTSRLSRLEKAQVGISADDVVALSELYGAPQELREALLGLARESEQKAWWDAYADDAGESYLAFIGLEHGAEEIWSWQTGVLPGLLQTHAYTHAMMEQSVPFSLITPRQVERRTKIRLRRQRLLTADPPLHFRAVLDEAVLHRRVGSAEVMIEQLRHLQKMASLPNVTVQVWPFDSARMAAWESFVLLRFPDVGEPLGRLYGDVLYQESYGSASLHEDEQEAYRYQRIFEFLTENALPERDSVEMIMRIADRLGDFTIS